MSALSDLVSEFVEELSAAIEADVMGRVRSNVESLLDGGSGVGRKAVGLSAAAPVRKRRKGPIQLCPVPGCKNRAAPVFGMVCSEHKNVAKSKIRKYREARKEAKGGKRGRTPKAKPARAARKAKPARVAKAKGIKRRKPTPKRTARATRRKAPPRRPPAAAASASPAVVAPAAASG